MDVWRSALAMVIYRNGQVEESDVDGLIERYREKKGIYLDRDIYLQAVASATRHYQKSESRLFVCTDSRCLDRSWLCPSRPNLTALERQLDCPVEATGCHWVCEEAPVVTLKKGSSAYRFEDCSSQERWDEVKSELALLLKDDSA
ncbi:MAG: (2Fe-2S) ferredoxin domain-containing protein [Candidatus Obscuribacterales bacterium]